MTGAAVPAPLIAPSYRVKLRIKIKSRESYNSLDISTRLCEDILHDASEFCGMVHHRYPGALQRLVFGFGCSFSNSCPSPCMTHSPAWCCLEAAYNCSNGPVTNQCSILNS